MTLYLQKQLQSFKSNNLQLQWVGRTRSQGLDGWIFVILIRHVRFLSIDIPDAMFVTVYDKICARVFRIRGLTICGINLIKMIDK